MKHYDFLDIAMWFLCFCIFAFAFRVEVEWLHANIYIYIPHIHKYTKHVYPDAQMLYWHPLNITIMLPSLQGHLGGSSGPAGGRLHHGERRGGGVGDLSSPSWNGSPVEGVSAPCFGAVKIALFLVNDALHPHSNAAIFGGSILHCATCITCVSLMVQLS